MNGHLRRSVLFMQKEPSFLVRGIQIFLTILFAAAFCQCQSAAGQEQQHQHSPSSSQSRQYHPPTPVIGGLCKLDSPDVQIGGKQTQFFLRCEPTAESAPGEGVWVVKSRNAGVTANRIPAAALVKSEQQPPQPPRKSAPKTTTYTCDLVSDAYENGACSTSENCLQPVYMERSAFLQCDSTNHQWVKKHCQQGFNFDFERQACIAHTTIRPGHQFRQYPVCPGGVAPLTSCASTGFCAPPLQCIQPGICCSMPAPPPIMIPPPPPPAAYACPGGLPALGQCIGGRCLSPAAVCASPGNICCAQTVVPAAIPATVCPDGTQAAGACVNNQCGAGFTCNQGLCCTNSSQTPRCLDGSQSIGACIAGKCGTGYTCTTGNICCPSQLNPCPPGQVSIGLAVNGRCPAGFTLVNGQCCGAQSNSQSQITCPEIDSTGPCDNNQQCPEPGFACDTANNWCCPQVFENEDAIGPCIQGEGGTRLCPEGYACVGEGEGECRRLDTGTCPPEEQLGPCGANNECPAGYECLEGFCCRIDNNTGRYRRKRSQQQQSSAFLRLVRGM